MVKCYKKPFFKKLSNPKHEITEGIIYYIRDCQHVYSLPMLEESKERKAIHMQAHGLHSRTHLTDLYSLFFMCRLYVSSEV